MRFKISQKIIALSFVIAFALLIFSCGEQSRQQTGVAQSPTEAYKMLFAAVKSKDTEKIRQIMSKNSLTFAEGASKQQNKPIEKVLENGFYASTFSAALPRMRDERIKDSFGAVEVWNEKERIWEDVAVVREADVSFQFTGGDKAKFLEIAKGISGLEVNDGGSSVQGGVKGVLATEAEDIKNKLTEAGATVSVADTGWKIAVGDIFRGTYQMPGKSQTVREREDTNMMNPNNAVMPGNINTNVNMNAIPMTNVKTPPLANKDDGAKKK